MEFTSTEGSIIRNMMLNKSCKDIAGLLDLDVEAVNEYVTSVTAGTGIITYQARIDEKKATRSKANAMRIPKPPKEKKVKVKKQTVVKVDDRKEQKRRNKEEADMIEGRRKLNLRESRRQYKTIDVDYSKMVTIRIDRTTIIYSKPGEEEATKTKFLKHYKRPIDNIK